MCDLKVESEKLHAHVDDQDSTSQRQNIRVVGLLEKIENGHTTTFKETFLVEVLVGGQLPS